MTVRRLTQELGVTPMALYWHFRNKEHLLDGLTERVVLELDLAVDESATWLRQLESLLTSTLRVLRAHPWCAALFVDRATRSAGYLHALDVLLDILRRGGFSPADAVRVARHALRTLTTLVAGEPSPVDQRTQRVEHAFLESQEHRPRLIEAATPLTTCDDPDTHYRFGLNLLLAGIAQAHDANRTRQHGGHI